MLNYAFNGKVGTGNVN